MHLQCKFLSERKSDVYLECKVQYLKGTQQRFLVRYYFKEVNLLLMVTFYVKVNVYICMKTVWIPKKGHKLELVNQPS